MLIKDDNISEEFFIRTIQDFFPDHEGYDVAYLGSLAQGKKYTVTKDLLIENIHMKTEYVSPKSLACKAVHSNLSDLSASGSDPLYIILGISFPKSLSKYVYDFLQNMCYYCAEEGVEIIGGDTTSSPAKFFISITAFGSIDESLEQKNYKPKKNDIVCIIGNLGYAHIGLCALEKKISGLSFFKNKYLFPKARIKEGVWLRKKRGIGNITDISDCLHVNMTKVCRKYSLSAMINLESIPISSSFKRGCRAINENVYDVILGGGEDYGLLFSVDRELYANVQGDFVKDFSYKITPIGFFYEQNTKGQLLYKKNNQTFDINNIKIFSHF